MASKPKSDPDMFDLDALAAEESEESFQFRAGGKVWTIPPYSRLDWRVLEYADSNDLVFAREALRLALGDRWPEFDELRGFGIVAINELFTRWVAHSGVRPGESQASSDS